jgi:rubrerythrin
MNVFEFALKMEKDGQAYYEKLAGETTLQGLKTIFSRLAEDEQQHYAIFQSLQEGRTVTVLQESSTLDQVKNIFASLPLPEVAGKNLAGTLDAYEYAMQVEAESVAFYEKAATAEKNPQTKELLLRIASEEQQHFKIMENLFHFVNAPNQYLADAEFSNVDEQHQFGRETDS